MATALWQGLWQLLIEGGLSELQASVPSSIPVNNPYQYWLCQHDGHSIESQTLHGLTSSNCRG
jgi:hypothetical protein